MAIILFDDNAHQTLLPLTFTRPVGDLRIGILTIAEKWARFLVRGLDGEAERPASPGQVV